MAADPEAHLPANHVKGPSNRRTVRMIVLVALGLVGFVGYQLVPAWIGLGLGSNTRSFRRQAAHRLHERASYRVRREPGCGDRRHGCSFVFVDSVAEARLTGCGQVPLAVTVALAVHINDAEPGIS